MGQKTISFILKIMLVPLFFFSISCTTMKNVENARGTGQTMTFDSSYNAVFEATIATLVALPLNIQSRNLETGTILAQRGASMSGGWGENVAVFVQEVSAKSTTVEIVSQKAISIHSGAQDWTRVFERIQTRLAQK